MRVSLHEGDPFVRVEMAIDWHERRRLLRIEHDLDLVAREVVYGAPHGAVRRSTRFETPAERARFEVPGQRFAYVCDDRGDGFASFALDTYGWSGRMEKDDAMLLGHSLLRGTVWPDPGADIGEHALTWAVAPTRNATLGALEAAWRRFARLSGVPLFDSGDESIVVERVSRPRTATAWWFASASAMVFRARCVYAAVRGCARPSQSMGWSDRSVRRRVSRAKRL